jgi:NAD(P)-dependent dehydrogenase (short-subunit alcohol dehydrogenase family)
MLTVRTKKVHAMAPDKLSTALIVGAGSGLSAALARALSREGAKVALAARSTADLAGLMAETGAKAYACDASRHDDVTALFAALDRDLPALDVVIYNASYRIRGPVAELDQGEVEKTLAVTAFGGFLVAQQAARRMVPKGQGTIVFTGASASVKGYAESAPFAMGKFALRGLAQSMARELSPRGIHVAHIVIDGGIRSERRVEAADSPASMLHPADIAETYIHIIRQPRSAWTHETEVRPWVEKF